MILTALLSDLPWMQKVRACSPSTLWWEINGTFEKATPRGSFSINDTISQFTKFDVVSYSFSVTHMTP